MYQPETPPVLTTDSQPLTFGVADANMDFTFESMVGMDEGLAKLGLKQLSAPAGGEDVGHIFATLSQLSENSVEQGLNHAAKSDDGTDTHGLGRALTDGAGNFDGTIEEWEESSLLVEITSHEFDPWSNDATLVTA